MDKSEIIELIQIAAKKVDSIDLATTVSKTCLSYQLYLELMRIREDCLFSRSNFQAAMVSFKLKRLPQLNDFMEEMIDG